MNKNLPPMGFNTWNTFGKDINADLIKGIADTLIEKGLDKVGYNYIVIDDCWSEKTRDKKGRLVPDKKKFPKGIKDVSDYVHSKGLKFGMYSCIGTLTCAGYPASFNHEYTDALTFAEWGVDYLKYDFCFKPSTVQGKNLYRKMAYALSNCGREIILATCSWGEENTHEWVRTTGANTWRSTGDLVDAWASLKYVLEKQFDIMPYGGKGCFNDMDMLICGMNGKGNVGLKGCTEDEYKLHFSAWCLFGSPLMIGCDIRSMDKKTEKMLKNKMLIKIDQDELCAQPYFVTDDRQVPVIAKRLSNGDMAIGVFNLTDNESNTSFSFEDLGLPNDINMKLEFTDVFSGEKTMPDNGVVLVELKEHASKMWRVKLVK